MKFDLSYMHLISLKPISARTSRRVHQSHVYMHQGDISMHASLHHISFYLLLVSTAYTNFIHHIDILQYRCTRNSLFFALFLSVPEEGYIRALISSDRLTFLYAHSSHFNYFFMHHIFSSHTYFPRYQTKPVKYSENRHQTPD